MDIILIIVIAVLALAVGACVSYFIISKRGSGDSKIYLEENETLKRDNISLLTKLEDSDKNIINLNESLKKTTEELESSKRNINDLKNTLSEKEREFESSIEVLKTHLSLVSGNADENEILKRFKSYQDDIVKYNKKVSELEKEIENLNEEIEDAEDEAKKFQRRLEEKSKDCNRLEISLKESNKKINELILDLNSKTEELRIKTDDLSLKISSIKFIREILTAGFFDDTNFVSIEQKVNIIEDFIENDLRLQQAKLSNAGISGLSDNLMKGIDESIVKRWAIYQKKIWIQGKKAIAFVGEFSAGKTSIVNRILQENDKNATGLPVSAKATTAIPTYISGGPKLTFSFITPSNERKKITEETFKQVNKEVLEQIEGISALIKYFVMTYRNPALEKISILDTPGFNSNDSEDAERTSEVINECDALFWVMDVNAGEINNSSRAVIKKYLNIPLFIVINKTDTKAPSEVEKAKEKIASTLANDGIKVEEFILFGHKVPISSILSVISEKVIHKGDQDNFLRNIRDNMKNVYETLKNETSKFNAKKSEYSEQSEQLQYEFDDNCNQLQYLAERISEIGKQKGTYLGFGKDVWQMSLEEKQELDTLCQNDLEEIVYGLKNISDKQKINAKNSENASSKYSNLKATTQEFAELSQKFIKYAMDFQTIIKN